jgi:hypothetical protein
MLQSRKLKVDNQLQAKIIKKHKKMTPPSLGQLVVGAIQELQHVTENAIFF